MGFRGDFPTQSSNSAQSMGYRSGVVVAFNKVTLENVISVGGADLVNLPILGVAEAATLEPGDVVGIMVVGSTWAILGQLVTPGTAEATNAITQLANKMYADTQSASDLIPSTSYGDLNAVGPTITDVLVGASGKLVVMPSVSMGVVSNATDGFAVAAFMGYDISGATAVTPSDERSARLGVITVAEITNVTGRVGGAFLHTGLTPGLHTIQAKYRVESANDVNQASANDRTLVVFSL